MAAEINWHRYGTKLRVPLSPCVLPPSPRRSRDAYAVTSPLLRRVNIAARWNDPQRVCDLLPGNIGHLSVTHSHARPGIVPPILHCILHITNDTVALFIGYGLLQRKSESTADRLLSNVTQLQRDAQPKCRSRGRDSVAQHLAIATYDNSPKAVFRIKVHRNRFRFGPAEGVTTLPLTS